MIENMSRYIRKPLSRKLTNQRACTAIVLEPSLPAALRDRTDGSELYYPATRLQRKRKKKKRK